MRALRNPLPKGFDSIETRPMPDRPPEGRAGRLAEGLTKGQAGRHFFDTNILVYAFAADDPRSCARRGVDRRRRCDQCASAE